MTSETITRLFILQHFGFVSLCVHLIVKNLRLVTGLARLDVMMILNS